jgi:hypothetical protein
MVATPFGQERLTELIEQSCRLVLTNETDPAGGATILAAAFVLHAEDGSTQPLAFFGLKIGPGATGTFDHNQPAQVVLVEALLRLRDDERTAVVDAYAVAAEEPQRPLRSVTFGIKTIDAMLAPEERPVSSAPRLAVFGRAAP